MRFLTCIFISLYALDFGLAQGQEMGRVELSANYVSQVDEQLTIRKITVLPGTDNVDGIYSRPLENHLISLIKMSHRFDYIEAPPLNSVKTAGELEEAPSEVSKILAGSAVDGALVVQLMRGPNGISIRLNLFAKFDGKLLLQDMVRDLPSLDVNQAKLTLTAMYQRLTRKFPYMGMVSSRQQNRVTLNIGSVDGVSKDQYLSVVQIVQVQRHPKFQHLISTDKEILGKIKITKVEDTLSFGSIVMEKERGVIRKGHKVASGEGVQYPEPVNNENNSNENSSSERPDAKTAFGDNPKEWLPQLPPTFGMISFAAGLGSYSTNTSLSSGGIGSSSSFYPSMLLQGELWITPNWVAIGEMDQSLMSTDNPRSNSQPGKLNHALSIYNLSVGYNFLLKDEFFGPRFRVRLGMENIKYQVDDSSPNKAFTSTSFFGYLLGISGLMPIADDKTWYFGGELTMLLMPKMSESPVSSGGAGNITINTFDFLAEKSITKNLRAYGDLEFSLTSASLSGTGTRTDGGGTPETSSSISHRSTRIRGGIRYMF